MMTRMSGRLGSALRRVRGFLGPRCVILLYHRIADEPADPYGISVSPAHFAAQMQVVSERCFPMRLGELVRRVRTGELPKRAVCITFDDAYQDNLYTAKPILERFDVPATVFVTTGKGGRTREFWWDELERVFLRTNTLPDRLELEVGGKQISAEINGTPVACDDERRVERWQVFDPDPPTSRHAAFQLLYPLLRESLLEDQTATLDRLLEWSEAPPVVRDSRRVLNPEEVVTLASDGLVEIGAHTVNHVSLSSQPQPIQREEISRSKDTLEEWLGQPVKSFAYPYGNFTEATITEVGHAGFERACACMGMPVPTGADHFILPRVDAPNDGAEAFERQLHRLFGVRA